MSGAAEMMCGAANMMSWFGRHNACEVWRVGQNQSQTPPNMAKNNFLLNEYLGIFMHFFRPTHYIWKIPDFFSFF